MPIDRRDFLKASTIVAAAAVLPPLVPTKSHALGFTIFVAAMGLAKTIFDMTGKPFRAKQDPNARKADPYLVSLRQNRQILRQTHLRLDAMDAALTAILIQNQLLPEQIDRIVANRIQTMVPEIVRSELGKFGTEKTASDLSSAVTTFVEDVELGLPADRLNHRLDRVREFRNRVRMGSDYSILTLCAAMDVELAAMKILKYDSNQARVIADIYRKEFSNAMDGNLEGSLLNKYGLMEKELGMIGNEELNYSNQYYFRLSDNMACKLTTLPTVDNRYLISSDNKKFPFVSLIWKNQDYSDPDVVKKSCFVVGSNSKVCRAPNFTTSLNSHGVPHHGCASTVAQANEIIAFEKMRLTDVYDRVNALEGLRAVHREMLITVHSTRTRLDQEVAEWDT